MAAVKFPQNVLEPVRKHLLSKKAQLEKRKSNFAQEDPFADPDRLNDNAALDADAAEQFGHERVEAMEKETDKNLVRIKKALTRIKIGSYGICEDCGQMIDTDRLAIDPTAQYCVNCESKRGK